jgi:hypothetical protein
MSFSRGERAEGRAHSSMEIAPIAGVRAVSLQRQPKTADASQPQFKIDASERTEDDTYSPDREHSDDTLEDEGALGAQEEKEQETGPADSTPASPEGRTINIIA